MSRNAFYGLALLVFALDQATKAWLRATVALNDSVRLWPGVFYITYTQNRGAAFSLLQGATPFLAVTAIVVIAALVYAQRRAGARLPLLLALSLALPLGGALGNLLDRVRLGYVTDMFDFGMRTAISSENSNLLATWRLKEFSRPTTPRSLVRTGLVKFASGMRKMADD